MQRIIQTVSAEAAAHLQIRRSIVAALGVSLLTNAALALTLLTKTDNSRTVVCRRRLPKHLSPRTMP